MAISNRYSIFSYLIKIGLVACLALGLAACDSSSGSNNGGSSNTIDAIELSLNHISLITGSEMQLILTARYTDGSSKQVTNQANWQSDNDDIAAVNTTGTIFGMANGKTIVTATFKEFQAQVTVVVNNAEMTGLQLEYDTRNIIVGLDIQLTLTAFYDNGLTAIVTDSADDIWTTANDSVATVTPAGRVVGIAPGTTTITATFEGHTRNVVVNVIDAPLESIQLTPSTLNIVAEATAQLTLMGFYDGYSRVVNDHATWGIAGSDSGAATVSTAGEVTGIKAGTTEVTVELEGYEQSTQITVFETDSIKPEYDTPQIIQGLSKQLTLIALYNDGDRLEVTNDAIWKSDDDKIATVINGEVFGVATGMTTIHVEFAGHKEQVEINVVDKYITRLELECKNNPCNQIAAGLGTELKLTAFYDDGTQDNVTTSNSFYWQSSEPGVATVNAGQVTSETAGETTITATFAEQHASIDITVTNAVVDSLRLDPNNVYVVAEGLEIPLVLRALYSDGTEYPVTGHIDWDKVDPDNNVTVTPEGNVAGVQAGTATITAIFDGMEASANVNVADADDGIDITVEIASSDDSNGQVRILYGNGAMLRDLSESYQLAGIHPASELILEAVPDKNTAGEDIANFIDWFGSEASYYDNASWPITINEDMDNEIFTANFYTPMTTIYINTYSHYGYISLLYTNWRTNLDGIGGVGNVCDGSYSGGINCSIEVPTRIGTLYFHGEPSYEFAGWSDDDDCPPPKWSSCKINPQNFDDTVNIRAQFY